MARFYPQVCLFRHNYECVTCAMCQARNLLLLCLFSGWVESSSKPNVVFCKMDMSKAEGIFTLCISQDFMWSVTLHHNLVDRSTCKFLHRFPESAVSATDVAKLACALNRCTVCEGNQDAKFLVLAATRKRGLFKDQAGMTDTCVV